MKRTVLGAIFAFTLLLAALPIFAISPKLLTPALNILSEDEIMIKSGIVTGNIAFTEEDFRRTVGCDINSITVTALPPASEGVLMYNSTPVIVNQTISASSLEYLYFVPTGNISSSSFRFKAGGEYSICCELKYTDSYNMSPTVKNIEASVPVWTQADISTYGTLSVSDPEGDKLYFEIVELPTKGIIEITNKSQGNYKYTPFDSLTGKDRFSYVVRDEWGNYSEVSTVIVDIEKPAADLVFADLNEHWAHNAAIVMVAGDAMVVESINEKLYFNPDKEITREEFLVTVMKVLGAGEIDECSTVFADDEEISEAASGYVNRAYKLGVISGSEIDGLRYFRPKDKITRAEAAVILNSIIGEKSPDVYPVFADSQSVPSWAKSDFYALATAGVFSGTGGGYMSPNAPLTRAQTAQILLTVKKLYVD